MMPLPQQDAALAQLGAVPGVVGSMVFDGSGALVGASFPPVFDPAGLEQLAQRLAGDGYFQEWLGGDQGAMHFHYLDGQVVVRPVAGTWLLTLCTLQVNAQLLAMSLTQVVRRLRVPDATAARLRTGEHPLPAAAAPTPLERLRAIAKEELGDHAAQALEILAAAGPGAEELLGAVGDVEKMTRLFINKKAAEALGRKMRSVLGR